MLLFETFSDLSHLLLGLETARKHTDLPVMCQLAFHEKGHTYSGMDVNTAVDALTRVLAKELGPRKIRVNAINPGMVETEGVHAAGIAGSEMQKGVEAQTPLGRIGQPQDIATAAVFLASTDSAWVTGETFVISGGMR